MFSGNPKTEWLEDLGEDRKMKLLEDFAFADPTGRRWLARKGDVINGASIPAPLWSTIGSPYTGEYRRASIVHDIACNDPTVNRKQADEMFYYACLAGGCSQIQARLLYSGVRIGAWLPNVRLWSNSISSSLVMDNRITSSLTENSIRTTFNEIALDLTSLPEDTTFKVIDEVVENHLISKSTQ